MGMANGKTMAFALLAENRYGYQENHTDKLATKSRTRTAQRWTEVAAMRLIDGDTLWEKLDDEPWYDNADRDEISLPIVAAAPTVDAVVVVRCKDCKYLRVWNQKDLYAFCPKTNFVFLPFQADTRTHFCSYGEPKEKL